MKKIVIVLLALAVIVTVFTNRDIFNPTAVRADSITDGKADQPCTGHETAGRCADKCADPNQILQGYDKTTGVAICYTPIKNPCPYAQAEPADSAVCKKLTTEHGVSQTAPTNTPNNSVHNPYTPLPDVEGFTGK